MTQPVEGFPLTQYSYPLSVISGASEPYEQSRPMIVYAEQPRCFYNRESYSFNPDLPRWLGALGFTADKIRGLAFVFHDSFPEIERKGWKIGGYFDETGHQEMCGDHMLFYPLAIHIKNGLGLCATNSVAWHELGHGLVAQLRGPSTKEIRRAYHDDRLVRLTRGLGSAAVSLAAAGDAFTIANFAESSPLLGAIAASVISGVGIVASYAALKPHTALWWANKEERRCVRLARQLHDYPLLLNQPTVEQIV